MLFIEPNSTQIVKDVKMNRSAVTNCLLSLLCLVLFGCASGPTYTAVQAHFPVVASGKGRVFIYRPGLYQASGIQPDILVDGQRVGSAVPGAYFFVDLAQGSHAVSCANRTVNINLLAGQSRYVELEPYGSEPIGGGLLGVASEGITGTVRPILIAPSQGSQEILELSYINH